jgi:hypothetical protein
MCSEPRYNYAPQCREWIRDKIRSGQLFDWTGERVQDDVHEQGAESESLGEIPLALRW